MLQIRFKWRFSAAVFAYASAVAATHSAGEKVLYDPKAGGVRLVQKSDLDGRINSHLVVKAKGPDAVSKLYGSLNGVLFQAVARPSESLNSLPIKLSYTSKNSHDYILRVAIGDEESRSDVPAWIWAVAAKFANHDATGAVTLNDNAATPVEKWFQRRWRADQGTGQRLVWARYHPAVDNTLMGFFLVTADAMLGDAAYIRMMPNGLTNFEKYSGYSLTINRTKSARAARTLDGVIRLEANAGDSAMLNDVGETFVFSISNGKLQIRGDPHYHFARKTGSGEFREVKALSDMFRKNRHIYLDTNPPVYEIVADFARLVAFFEFVNETDAEQLDAFVNTLGPVLARMPVTNTPIALPLTAR